MINEITEMKQEEEIIYNSMFWSYMVLTKQITFDDLLDLDEEFGLIFDPNEFAKADALEIIDVLVEYFIDLEAYEKCQDLIEAKQLYTKKKKKKKKKVK